MRFRTQGFSSQERHRIPGPPVPAIDRWEQPVSPQRNQIARSPLPACAPDMVAVRKNQLRLRVRPETRTALSLFIIEGVDIGGRGARRSAVIQGEGDGKRRNTDRIAGG